MAEAWPCFTSPRLHKSAGQAGAAQQHSLLLWILDIATPASSTKHLRRISTSSQSRSPRGALGRTSACLLQCFPARSDDSSSDSTRLRQRGTRFLGDGETKIAAQRSSSVAPAVARYLNLLDVVVVTYTSLFCSTVDTAWRLARGWAAVEWWAWWRPADDGVPQQFKPV